MKSIIGMVHLAGGVEQALAEIELYNRNGLAGALVENYHGSIDAVERTLEKAQRRGYAIPIGVNILPNEHQIAFALAQAYDARFIQLDHVAGSYQGRPSLNGEQFERMKIIHPQVRVLGGVWPKYYKPIAGSNMAQDIALGATRADVLVVTGEGTGKETPIDKITQFRSLTSKPLYIGAGVTSENATKQLALADGAIIGSYFKHGDTRAPVDETLVRRFMESVRQIA